ncbi:hypothetical protein GCM10011392_13970 [Wenxinia marina]|nr:hypothetical protein GCM10011392_13970 [Wenxinia marina]
MASGSLLWDTCVLYRWLNAGTPDYTDHLKAYLDDLNAGRVDIYLSTISLAEIRPSKIGRSALTPAQVISSINKSFKYVDPSPDIMSLAGYLRDQRYRQVDGPDERASSRELSLGDSIHLATAVSLREEFGVQNLSLHSFDEGKKRDGETGQKAVPIVGFHNWCRDTKDDDEIQKVLSIPKSKPVHPSCPLPKTSS